MTDLTLQIINLCIESTRLKKQLIKKYSGSNDAVSRIIVKDSHAAIRQTQEEIKFFVQLEKSNNIHEPIK